MLERYLQDLRTAETGSEEPADTRARLKGLFPPGAVRRMTQLGLLVGAALDALQPAETDVIVYASCFGESRALEAYLESFPEASPTLFQTSVHPSGVQQGLIGRQRPARDVFPLAGDGQLVVQALLTALLAPGPRALVAGGEERGTWLVPAGAASDRTFAFAVALTREAGPAPLGRLALRPAETDGRLEAGAWYDLLQARRAFAGPAGTGWHLELGWT